MVKDQRRRRRSSIPNEAERFWYKDAIIYTLHVSSFYDGNGDGRGDFQGLIEKLDYLQDLGVTALCLLPFYPSPLKADGYDIAEFTNVHPDVGSLGDFRRFLTAAHRRGMRVITELVLNHTSDQHPWFERARRADATSRCREFYLWSDTPERYKEAQGTIKDVEFANWTWDPAASAYYWHHAQPQQPDLNYDSEDVCQAMVQVVDFWLDLGVDGLQLDGARYLYKREGTRCEDLPENHDFLKALRRHVDQNFTGRLLLVELDRRPADARPYFGEGDQCHMTFNYPLLPNLFKAIRLEDSEPIIHVLERIPPLPDGCEWALSLQEYDDLALQRVSDEQRDSTYRVSAHMPDARLNAGPRRRLASLLNNNRRQIELLNGLLFSLPGTPVLYYGDEIGMGDNVYLGERKGVRTPMQWSADRNAGFSVADPERLLLPVITTPDYQYEAVNVETQQAQAHSLLQWTKGLISQRKRSLALSRGDIQFLSSTRGRILSFVRTRKSERVLVVANLSSQVQGVELDLSGYMGIAPVELFGGGQFPPIGDDPYFLTLGPHSFYWLALDEVPRAYPAA